MSVAILGWQVFIFVTIIISGRAAGYTAAFWVIWTIVQIYTLPMSIIQFGTISIAYFIRRFINKAEDGALVKYRNPESMEGMFYSKAPKPALFFNSIIQEISDELNKYQELRTEFEVCDDCSQIHEKENDLYKRFIAINFALCGLILKVIPPYIDSKGKMELDEDELLKTLRKNFAHTNSKLDQISFKDIEDKFGLRVNVGPELGNAKEYQKWEIFIREAKKKPMLKAAKLYDQGMAYIDGISVEKDVEKGLEILHVIANDGYAEAQNMLSFLYGEDDEDIEQNLEESFKWGLRAAEQGDEDSYYLDVAEKYLSGSGTPRLPNEAFSWAIKAAKNGHPWGQSLVGRMYACGNGIEKDTEQAIKWLNRALEQGHSDVLEELGHLKASRRAEEKGQ